MPKVQTYQNHTRFEPPFHFVLMPILLLNLVFSIYLCVRHYHLHAHLYPWYIIMSVALILAAALSRVGALKVQDRVIRLEERLRLASLLPAADLPQTAALTERQLVALRFASDAELPALARRAVAEGLTPAQIKANIVTWRPDNFRV